MNKGNTNIWSRILYGALAVVCGLYLLGIFWTNCNAQTWFNYDLYADAKLAQLMYQTGSLFPREWSFGNQLYVIATPVVAALLYPITSDSALALGIASCIMTVLLVSAFGWCIRPFVKRKHILVGFACFVGGVLIGSSASSDFEGFQIFFTMGSYYSCYLFCILITLGLWLRLYTNQTVHSAAIILCLLMNSALGMQSLRQMLCMNLPLCALSLLIILLKRASWKRQCFSGWNLLAIGCFIANAAGILLIHYLKLALPIQQSDILAAAEGSFRDNVHSSVQALAYYIGFTPMNGTPFSWFSWIAGALFTGIVILAVFQILWRRDTSPLACGILFCMISICAVLAAGMLLIQLRAIYFFVWHLTVTFSVMYLMESSRKKPQNALCAVLLSISLINLVFQYQTDLADFSRKTAFYKQISSTLMADGVTHVYYNLWGMNNAARIAAVTKDQLLFCAVTPILEHPEEGKLFSRIPYLYKADWFDPDQKPQAYLCLSGGYQQDEWYTVHRQLLEPHLELVHRFSDGDEDYCFYRFDDAVYSDLVDGNDP